ncbi:hypothetical protein HNP52_000030 [Sphingomonas kyeonggiensis]|uniref:Uncharacterized protein n=1 Tax=Sphingomonas kyeonggiensis TaxID=1268553 RepID=A0A7W7JXC8_9SPHN|nr:hypothetical protein [Sphingomonas kyeonggiensis]MBB4836979.1 hypothetical protein [Sphingomonas kyeonggiensis]
MTDPAVSGAIARHIEELEVALRHATNVMDRMLGREAGRIIQRKMKAFGWDGEIDEELDPVCWVAQKSWRTAGGTNDAFDLYINFEGTDCNDGQPPETWVGQFMGFAGSGMQLVLGSNALGRAKWKSVLREQVELVDQLMNSGFRCDAREGRLAVAVQIDKEALISGFEDGDVAEALLPIEAAIDRIHAAEPILDRLVAAIRAKI